MTTPEEFVKKNGEIKQSVTGSFVSSVVGTQYNVSESIAELIDNAIDNRVGNTTKITISKNDKDSTLIIRDEGEGISDPNNLFVLGYTSKSVKSGFLGKYGIGLKGATSSIANKCRNNVDEPVEIVINSACNAKEFTMRVAYFPNKNNTRSEIFKWGKPVYKTCDKDLHYTEITFMNVNLSRGNANRESIWKSEIICGLQKYYSETFKKRNIGLSIDFVNNGKPVESNDIAPVFSNLCKKEVVKVGNFNIEVMRDFFKLDNDSNDNDVIRSYEESALRIYDKDTGRLLAMDNNYWKWFANRSAQPSICGLRVGVYIDSSEECYHMFGIKSSKNGVNYSKYYNNPKFKKLYDFLAESFRNAVKENNGYNHKNSEDWDTLTDDNSGIEMIEMIPNSICHYKIDHKFVGKIKKHIFMKISDKKCMVAPKYFKDHNVLNLVKMVAPTVKSGTIV